MPKRWKPSAVCLWPGLRRLWNEGAASGLGMAVGFAAILNVLLAASLVWTRWLSPTVLAAGWLAVAVFWLVSLVHSVAAGGGREDGQPDGGGERECSPDEDLFREAIAQYLQGNWFEAEDALRRTLAENTRDCEAMLMLATLLRHSGRLEDAAAQLQRTARLEASAAWRQELETEWRRISEAERDNQQGTDAAEEADRAAGEAARAA